MEQDNRNLLLAVLLSTLVMAGWWYFVAGPQMKAENAQKAHIAKQENAPQPSGIPGVSVTNGQLSLAQAVKDSGPRVTISTPTVDGSLLLKGARFDDLRLRSYHDTVDPKSPEIVLLSPKRTAFPYYTDFGWTEEPGAHIALPSDQSEWKVVGGTAIAPGKPVVLEWNNGQGLVFDRKIAVDDKYMFTVTDTVRNTGAVPVTLFPYASVARENAPKGQHFWALHEGFVGVANGTLQDPTYDDFKDNNTPPKTFTSTGGWAGITDKYWMTAVIPDQSAHFDGAFQANALSDSGKAYQTYYRLGGRAIAPGQSIDVTQRMFAGAKVFDIIRGYEHRLNIQRFDLAIDWGWFIVITQPLFWVLDQLFHLLGNFGLAILALTVLVKLVTFPIANASAKTMVRMKKVQPEMERIKERFKDDAAAQQREIMDLYRREKVNPLTGCVPQLLVIPVFFSLYKVFLTTIEMYHQPFYGWIKDLSAPDPTSLLNLFGLLPYHIPLWIPAYLSIGIWPILMGMTQWVQTKLNPPAADPVQARMFSLMPIMFTFMFATFPVGLVIYYAWNNLLTIAQQTVIMRSQGVPVHLFENPPKFMRDISGRVRKLVSRTEVQAGE